MKRFKEKFRPPVGLFASLHPSFFAAAAPSLPPGAQFTTFIHITMWLMLLNGKKGGALDADVDGVASLSDQLPAGSGEF